MDIPPSQNFTSEREQWVIYAEAASVCIHGGHMRTIRLRVIPPPSGHPEVPFTTPHNLCSAPLAPCSGICCSSHRHLLHTNLQALVQGCMIPVEHMLKQNTYDILIRSGFAQQHLQCIWPPTSAL
jgi:hypothetical protein